jgi:hypothetical protein
MGKTNQGSHTNNVVPAVGRPLAVGVAHLSTHPSETRLEASENAIRRRNDVPPRARAIPVIGDFSAMPPIHQCGPNFDIIAQFNSFCEWHPCGRLAQGDKMIGLKQQHNLATRPVNRAATFMATDPPNK